MAEVVAFAVDKANPIFVNPITRLWQVIHASQLMAHSFPEYLKLAEIAMILHVLGSIEDEHCFSLVFFLKQLHVLGSIGVGMKDKKVGFASWFDDMNKGCTCVGYFEQLKLQVEKCNNEHNDFVTRF